MSELVECDGCGEEGRRGRGRAAPDDWRFAVLRVHDGEIVVWACCAKCERRVLQWHRGPGRLDLVTGEITSGQTNHPTPEALAK
jgi:ribosomal protein L24E